MFGCQHPSPPPSTNLSINSGDGDSILFFGEGGVNGDSILSSVKAVSISTTKNTRMLDLLDAAVLMIGPVSVV